jgi:hypothetical protein
MSEKNNRSGAPTPAPSPDDVIRDSDLSSLVINRCVALGTERFRELERYTDCDLLKGKNFGRKSLLELEWALDVRGLKLRRSGDAAALHTEDVSAPGTVPNTTPATEAEETRQRSFPLATVIGNAREIHRLLAGQGVRIFLAKLTRGGLREERFWIHRNRTTAEWRTDLQGFIDRSRHVDREAGWATDGVENGLGSWLADRGYVELMDVVDDVFEGRITCDEARIVPDPEHEEDVTGFGHFGWGARAMDRKAGEEDRDGPE